MGWGLLLRPQQWREGTGAGVQKERGTWVQGYTGAQMHGCVGPRIPRNTAGLGRGGWRDARTSRTWGVLVHSRMDMGQQCARVGKEASDILAWVRNGVVSRSREGIGPLCWALVRLHLECCARLWAPRSKKDTEGLQRVQRRAVRLGRTYLEGGCSEGGLVSSPK